MRTVTKLFATMAFLVAGSIPALAEDPLYLTGDFNNWDYINPMQFKFTDGMYSIEFPCTGDGYFAISSTKGDKKQFENCMRAASIEKFNRWANTSSNHFDTYGYVGWNIRVEVRSDLSQMRLNLVSPVKAENAVALEEDGSHYTLWFRDGKSSDFNKDGGDMLLCTIPEYSNAVVYDNESGKFYGSTKFDAYESSSLQEGETIYNKDAFEGLFIIKGLNDDGTLGVQLTEEGYVTSVPTIIEESTDPAEYYTLEGLKVNNPSAGIFIRIKNGVSRKVRL